MHLTRASHTYVFMVGGVPVSWASKRVGNDSLGSCETEYMGLTSGAQEASYLGELKGDMYGTGGDGAWGIKALIPLLPVASAKLVRINNQDFL